MLDAPPHVHKCHALRKVPINRLTAGDLRMLITQDVGLKYLMPSAMHLLKQDPMLEADHYAGDLLCATMGVGSQYWSSAPHELVELKQLAHQAGELIACSSNPSHFRQVARSITQFQEQSVA